MAEKIAVFVDYDNQQLDVFALIELLRERGRVVIRRAYADWVTKQSYRKAVVQAGFELIDCPKVSATHKNAADIRLAVDCLSVSYDNDDIEIYVLPFLIYTEPRIARNLLLFRHSMLEQARLRAQVLNQKGALFPWRTINGEEASAYYAAGTAQYHINADIMYGLKKYVEITDDKSLLYNEGAEMLVETARFWEDLGFYSDRKGGKFCIHGVTGPDEYTAVVNNNAYTNLMARENLLFLPVTQPDYISQCVTRIIDGVERFYQGFLFACAPLVLVLRILFVQIRRVLQQDVAQVCGRILHIDGPLVALLDQQRDPA